MDKAQALHLLKGVLSEIAQSNGIAKTEQFGGLLDVDAKVREVRMILEGIDGLPASLLKSMLSGDIDFEANSRRITLPQAFVIDVEPGKCTETWCEGLSLFHNPNALHPVPEEMFPSIARHKLIDGQIHSILPGFPPTCL